MAHRRVRIFHFDSIFGPTSLITKYNEVGPRPRAGARGPRGVLVRARAAAAAPALEGGGWRGAQSGRARYAAAAAVLMAGYAVIDANALFADAHDFRGQVGTVSSAIDGFVAQASSRFVTDAVRITPFNVVACAASRRGFCSRGR